MNLSSFSFKKQIRIKKKVDVFVAGGGPAGFAAGIAASRQGCSVYLAENNVCFGGMGTAGMVPIFMQFGDGHNFNAGGIGREIYDNMWAAGGAGPYEKKTDNYFIFSFRGEVLKKVYDAMAQQSGMDFTFNTQVVAVETESDYVTHTICSSKNGLFAVEAKTFIDCTGDGNVAVWAGADFEYGDDHGDVMASTLCSIWAGVDWKTVLEKQISQASKLPDAFCGKVFTVEDMHLPGLFPVGFTTGGGNVGHVFGTNGLNEDSITQALIYARKQLCEYETYYKKYLTGFDNLELVATAAMLGIRETRRIIGEYKLNIDDFKARAVFKDEIGRYSYPVDIHASKGDSKSFTIYETDYNNLRYNAGESYGIPYRSLLPKKLKNMIVAGKCISSDRYIQSSIRVMPGCYITGQAAGIAAALSAKANISLQSLNVRMIQDSLKKMGAYLPNINSDVSKMKAK